MVGGWGESPQGADAHDARHGDVSSTPPPAALVSTFEFFSTQRVSQPRPRGRNLRLGAEREQEEKRNSTSAPCICISFARITMRHLTRMEGANVLTQA